MRANLKTVRLRLRAPCALRGFHFHPHEYARAHEPLHHRHGHGRGQDARGGVARAGAAGVELVGGDSDFRAEAEFAVSVRLMHILRFQPLDQCGIQDADTLALSAGQVDVDGPATAWEPDEIWVIHEVGVAADRVNGEGLKRLCVQNFPHGLGMHGRRVGEAFPCRKLPRRSRIRRRP